MKCVLYISQPKVGSAEEFLMQHGFRDLIPVLAGKHKLYGKYWKKIFTHFHDNLKTVSRILLPVSRY